MFYIFVGDVLNCGREGNIHWPTQGKVSVPCYLLIPEECVQLTDNRQELFK